MNIVHHKPNKSLSIMSRPIVVDLDGTLSDDRHRQHLASSAKLTVNFELSQRKWREYHSMAPLDKPNQSVLEMVNDWLNFPMHEVWIVTARPDWMQKETLKWLEFHLRDMPNLVAMRPNLNTVTSPTLKYEFLFDCLQSRLCCGYHLIVDNAPTVTKKLSSLGETLLYSNQSQE